MQSASNFLPELFLAPGEAPSYLVQLVSEASRILDNTTVIKFLSAVVWKGFTCCKAFGIHFVVSKPNSFFIKVSGINFELSSFIVLRFALVKGVIIKIGINIIVHDTESKMKILLQL